MVIQGFLIVELRIGKVCRQWTDILTYTQGRDITVKTQWRDPETTVRWPDE